MLRHKLSELRTIVIDQLFARVQVGRQLIEVLASRKVLKYFSATGLYELTGTLVLTMKLSPHLKAVAWLVATQGIASILEMFANP